MFDTSAPVDVGHIWAGIRWAPLDWSTLDRIRPVVIGHLLTGSRCTPLERLVLHSSGPAYVDASASVGAMCILVGWRCESRLVNPGHIRTSCRGILSDRVANNLPEWGGQFPEIGWLVRDVQEKSARPENW